MPIKPATLVLTGEDHQRVTVRIEQSVAAAFCAKGLGTAEVIALLTEALTEIEDPPPPGESLAVVVAGILLGFEFTSTGLIVTKFRE